MAGKMLSTEPTIDPSSSVRQSKLGAYTEVGARTILLEVAMDDYSYVVNDAQITTTTIGKFCSIAAMTRINPGNHPMHRATQAHFTYRASAYFPGEADDAEFFAWRREHHVHIGHDVWIGHGAVPAGPLDRDRRGGRRRRDRNQGRPGLQHCRRQSSPRHQTAVSRRHRRPAGSACVVAMGPRDATSCIARLSQARY